MRWPKKREFLSFFVLSHRFAGSDADYYEMLSFLERNMCLTRKVARKVLKRLINLGYIRKTDKGYVVRSLEDVLDFFYTNYFSDRASRRGCL